MSYLKNNRRPSQTGSTPKLNLVIMAAVSFIALVVLFAWAALGMLQEKFRQDTGGALGTVEDGPLERAGAISAVGR